MLLEVRNNLKLLNRNNYEIHTTKTTVCPRCACPVISPTTIEFHYGKHERAYIDTLNKLIEGTEFADMALEDIIVKSEGKLFNNAAQAWNHIFYFFQFSPDGIKEPSGKLRDAIESQFGSIEISNPSSRKQEPHCLAPVGYGSRQIPMESYSYCRAKTQRTQ